MIVLNPRTSSSIQRVVARTDHDLAGYHRVSSSSGGHVLLRSRETLRSIGIDLSANEARVYPLSFLSQGAPGKEGRVVAAAAVVVVVEERRSDSDNSRYVCDEVLLLLPLHSC